MAKTSASRPDPEGLIQKFHLVLRCHAFAAVAEATEKVAEGLVWSPVVSSTLACEAGFRFQGWTSPWLAIWLMPIRLVWDADREHT